MEKDAGRTASFFYMPGDFVPHVRMMDTGFQNPSLTNLFGLPYVVIRKPKPIDTTTLNYNWQLWETNAGGIYRRLKFAGEEVQLGEPLAEITHPFDGSMLATVLSPVSGVIFFSHEKPLVTENEIVYKILKRIHT